MNHSKTYLNEVEKHLKFIIPLTDEIRGWGYTAGVSRLSGEWLVCWWNVS